MDEALATLTRSGASGSLKADFRAVGDASTSSGRPKYAPAPVMVWLAKVIVGLGGGAHKDTPLFELCHLVRAINGLDDGTSADERRMLIFFGTEPASPGAYREKISQLAVLSGPEEGRILVTGEGLEIDYPDGAFSVRFGRLPFLSALYEFLAGMAEFSFYEEFNRLLDSLAVPDPAAGAVTFRQVQEASNKLSSILPAVPAPEPAPRPA